MMSHVSVSIDLPLFSPRSHWNSVGSHTFPDANVLLQLCAVGLTLPLRLHQYFLWLYIVLNFIRLLQAFVPVK